MTARVLFLSCVIVTLAAAGAAYAAAPGQRLVDYVSHHAAQADVREMVGLSIEGGHAVDVNGAPAIRGAAAVVHTRLAATRAASFTGQRLCVIAVHGRNVLRLEQVSLVSVVARNGELLAQSVFLKYPTCHRVDW